MRNSRKMARVAVAVAGFVAGCAVDCGAQIVATALEQAVALRAEGKFDEALDALRAESRKIKTAEGEGSPALLAVNDLAAEILVDKGDLATSSSLLIKTIAAREKLIAEGVGEHTAGLGGSFLTLTRLETSARRLPAAIKAGRRALLLLDGAPERDEAALARAQAELQTAADVLEEMVGPGSDVSVATRDEIASVFASLGMIPAAIAQRRKILEGLMHKRPVNAAAALQAADRLGRLMMTDGRADEAIPIVESSLPALGSPDAPEAIAARRLLGDLQFAAGSYALAEASNTAVLEATRRDAKPGSVALVADRLRGLLVALRCGPATRLPDWFDTAVKSLTKPAAPDTPLAIAGLLAAGRVQQQLGRHGAAVEMMARAFGLATAARVPDAGQIADLAAQLAAAQLTAGDTAAARKTAEKALPVAERDVGPGSAEVGFLRLLLADALARSGEAGAGLALAKKAIDRGLPRPDDAWEEMAIGICDRLAKADDALRDRYLAMRSRQFGPDHAHIIAACGLFGAARLAAGDWSAAVDFFQRALDLDARGDHPDRAANLVLLARAQHAAREPTQALATAAQGLAAWEQAAGADHPGTLAAAEVLVAAKVQAGDPDGVAELLERLSKADAIDDPVRRAAHLVRLADLVANHDKARAQELLQQAQQLPCWQEEPARAPGVSTRLAFTAALAAHALNAVGDPSRATEMLQQARRLALQSKDSAALLGRIERIAAAGERP